jgi:3-oxo-5alpha-steroid 4-dehydrogenase
MPTGLRDAREIRSWDETLDVLVVGLGAAGAAAALEATRAGAKTHLHERPAGGGGTSARSGGGI